MRQTSNEQAVDNERVIVAPHDLCEACSVKRQQVKGRALDEQLISLSYKPIESERQN
jgi:hypothetical protein